MGCRGELQFLASMTRLLRITELPSCPRMFYPHLEPSTPGINLVYALCRSRSDSGVWDVSHVGRGSRGGVMHPQSPSQQTPAGPPSL